MIAPDAVFVMRRWNAMNSTATGIVITAAAASFSGYMFALPSAPADSEATPLVRVSSCGLEVENLWERDHDGTVRDWEFDRELEDPIERKRWLIVGTLRRKADTSQSS